jgi:predicted S18 family serine protease
MKNLLILVTMLLTFSFASAQFVIRGSTVGANSRDRMAYIQDLKSTLKEKEDSIASLKNSNTLLKIEVRQEREQLLQKNVFIYISISLNFLLVTFLVSLMVRKFFKRKFFNFLSNFPEIENDLNKKKNILNELYHSRAISKKEFGRKENDLLKASLRKIQEIKLKEALEENLFDEQEFKNLNNK